MSNMNELDNMIKGIQNTSILEYKDKEVEKLPEIVFNDHNATQKQGKVNAEIKKTYTQCEHFSSVIEMLKGNITEIPEMWNSIYKKVQWKVLNTDLER